MDSHQPHDLVRQQPPPPPPLGADAAAAQLHQQQPTASTSQPLLSVSSRPLSSQEKDRLAQLDRLKFFLATAPSRWTTASAPQQPHSQSQHPALNRFLLPSGEYVSCVLWNGLYHITGTDIVRALVFRFEAFGRPVINMKKFEEGVFSDLRNLKPGTDACLEEPKSPFLDLLFKYQCIRTQKKQKVFYWFSVPHDRLFLDALERDLKREKMGLEPTTAPKNEPALSFTYDPKQSLYDQLLNSNLKKVHDEDLQTFDYRAPIGSGSAATAALLTTVHPVVASSSTNNSVVSPADILHKRAEQALVGASGSGASGSSSGVVPKTEPQEDELAAKTALNSSPFFSMFTLFEGSPTYKQRRKKASKPTRRPSRLGLGSNGEPSSASFEHPPTPPYAQGGYQPILDHHDQPNLQLMTAHTSMGHSLLRPFGLSTNTSEEDYIQQQQQRYSITPPDHSPIGPPSRPSTGYQLHSATAAHPPLRAYICPLYSCRQTFRQFQHLRRHLRSHRGAPKAFACDLCPRRYSRADLLEHHRRIHEASSAGMMVGGQDSEEEMDFENLREEEMEVGEVPLGAAYDDHHQPSPSGSAGSGTPVGIYVPPPRLTRSGSDPSDYYTLSSSQTQMQSQGHHMSIAPGGQSQSTSPPSVYQASADTSPYVETPQGSAWAAVRGHPPQATTGQHSQAVHHPSLLHVYPTDAYSGPAPPSLSINVHAAASFSGPAGGHGHVHPASAPAQKIGFDHSTLYPPTTASSAHSSYGSGDVVGGAGELRRHRSATPSVGPDSMMVGPGSRPTTSSTSGSMSAIHAYSAAPQSQHPFAYSIDELSSQRSSPHSQYQPHLAQQGQIPSPHHGSVHSGSPSQQQQQQNGMPSALHYGHSYATAAGVMDGNGYGMHHVGIPTAPAGIQYVGHLHGHSPQEAYTTVGMISSGAYGGETGNGGSPPMYQSGAAAASSQHLQQGSYGHPHGHLGQAAPIAPGYHYESQQQIAL